MSIQQLLANRYVSRSLGALGAAAGDYLITSDMKHAGAVAVLFLIYGAVHSTAAPTATQASAQS